MADLVLKSIRKDFGAFRAVEKIDLTFPHGKLTALLGPSGCGKTTLLRMIAGLEDPSRGQILLGDEDITARPAHQRKFGMVFQNFALFPHLRVAENIAYSLAIEGLAKPRRRARADELLDLVQLAGYGDRRIGELSGGQRQRVAIARALAQEPSVFLLDEPMSALDAKLREDMQVELRLLQQRVGITTIVVTHDQREAMTMADQIVVMSKGRAEQVGSPKQIYGKPANSFVASFIGKANFLAATAESGAYRLGDFMIEAPEARGFTSGSRVTLAVRPENVVIDSEGKHAGKANTLPAEITFIRDVGSTRDFYLTTPVGDFIVEYGAGESLPPLAVGDRLPIFLPPEHVHAFPRESTQTGAAA
ncbi:ABC transporter ATP-binding protein [Pseudooceanicola algae]|uniref:Sulfate/thiosulfate import ATP-binding protein CysA n=1 Tax=Pseudooceanicola algae TaxID=1537215 RepID=A0A418SGL3_9RHOB|nr:ABC transporter ATP-binding protein [Pseudooceanicola algae]QPM91671.1 Sulfate/thiosulfate import ATP-binding protein CysA [Pseudooceanicola algae]